MPGAISVTTNAAARARGWQAAQAEPAEEGMAAIEHGRMLAAAAAGANWAKGQGVA